MSPSHFGHISAPPARNEPGFVLAEVSLTSSSASSGEKAPEAPSVLVDIPPAESRWGGCAAPSPTTATH